MALPNETIELINSLGPFNHSAWKAKGVTITQEELLEGRADFLVSKIRKIITTNFTISQIRKMSIVDIGCYDGYILHQLSDLPFKSIVGIEPRKKNIAKGKNVRKLLGIKEKIEFKKGSIEDLGNNCFDIVLCIGVLHHVESISSALIKLNAICSRLLVLENLCIPSKHITDSFKADIEMKDLIYKSEFLCGITGQKFESNYYDGSAASTTVVSIPTIETMIMYLKILGHKNVVIEAGPNDFFKAMKKNTRPSQEVLLYSIKSSMINELSFVIHNYESNFIGTILDKNVVEQLYNKYVLRKKIVKLLPEAKLISGYIEGNIKIHKLSKYFISEAVFEVIKSLRFNANDKLTFELAKVKFYEHDFQAAVKLLKTLVGKLNSDWRTCYRSFYLLAMIYRAIGQKSLDKKYLKLCKSCNPEYPLLN